MLEVQNQGASRVVFSWGLSPGLIAGCFLFMSSHDLFFVNSWCLFLFFWGHQPCWIRAPTLWPHWILITPLKTLFLNAIMLGGKGSAYEFGGKQSIPNRAQVTVFFPYGYPMDPAPCMKRYIFPYWITVLPLLLISWPCICMSVSDISVMFQESVFLFLHHTTLTLL